MSKAFTIGLAVLGTVAFACGAPDAEPRAAGGVDSDQPTATEASPTATEASPAATEASPAAVPSGISVAGSEIGAIVVDGDGRTLYLFTSDTDGASTCYGSCEATWPPFTEERLGQPGSGIDTALLGTTVRDDGRVQVTYNGHPLYQYIGDQAAGDINGHGIGGQWFVFKGTGEPVDLVIIPGYEY
ncbi:MAG: hypothetical protein ACE5MI_10585 [Acidimicrobiia bacterium]